MDSKLSTLSTCLFTFFLVKACGFFCGQFDLHNIFTRIRQNTGRLQSGSFQLLSTFYPHYPHFNVGFSNPLILAILIFRELCYTKPKNRHGSEVHENTYSRLLWGRPLIQNEFIDQYMPHANGEFVKSIPLSAALRRKRKGSVPFLHCGCLRPHGKGYPARPYLLGKASASPPWL